MSKINSLIEELNEIEKQRVKKEEKDKQLAAKIKLEEETKRLQLLLEEKEKERKRLEEEEKLKKQKEALQLQLEELKNKKFEVADPEIIKIQSNNNIQYESTSQIKIKKDYRLYKNIFKNILFLSLGSLITFIFLSNSNLDDGIKLSLEHPKLIYITEIIEKEVIVEKIEKDKPIKQNNIKSNTKQTTTKEKESTNKIEIKEKQKCPISDPLCGMF